MADVVQYFSRRQVRKLLGVGDAKLDGWIRSGRLPAINISGSPRRPQYRISSEALRVFLESLAVAKPVQVGPPARRRQRAGFVERY